jgi:hypothetical protein
MVGKASALYAGRTAQQVSVMMEHTALSPSLTGEGWDFPGRSEIRLLI